MKKRRRSKRSLLEVGDRVEARVGDDWIPGAVSRSLFRGVEMDVRLDDGRVMKNLSAREVRLVEKGEGLTILKK